MADQALPPRAIADSDRWDYYTRELDRVHSGLFARPVALMSLDTGAVLASYESLAAAYRELPNVPAGVKARAWLGWAEQASTRSAQPQR